MSREIPPIEWFYRENSKKKVADWRKFEQYQEAILDKFPYLRGRPRVDIWNGFKAGKPTQPKCQAPDCIEPVNLLAAGWKKYCCNACSNIGTAAERARVIREKTPEEKFETLEKRKNTNKEIFGVEHAAQSEIIREKTTRTNIERYGAAAPAQSAEIKELMKSRRAESIINKELFIKRGKCIKPNKDSVKIYRDLIYKKFPWLSTGYSDRDIAIAVYTELTEQPVCKNCSSPTTFGWKHVATFCSTNCANTYNSSQQSSTKKNLSREEIREIAEKRSRTNLERYGVENVLQKQSPFLCDIAQTNLERYGVEYSCVVNQKKYRDRILAESGGLYRNSAQLHIPPGVMVILESKEKLEEFYREKPMTVGAASDLLGIDSTVLVDRLNRYGIERWEMRNQSQAERDIAEYIESLGFNIERNRRDLLKPSRLEIDIFVPELNIAFEYNGLYWHSYDHEPTTEERQYHRKKYELAQSNGIKLFFLTSDIDIERVKRYIASKLKKTERIFARKCALFVPSVAEYRQFCEENHIQGYTPASVRYALKYEGRIVGAIGFNRVKEGEWLLNRMVFGELTIVGGAKKLLSAFRKEHSGLIVSYSSNHYSDGSLYSHLGFNMTAEHKSDLWYVKDDKFVNRRNLQKKKMKVIFENFDPTKTEISNALNNNYRVYYGPGTKTWVLE